MSFVEYRESVDYVWVLARAFDRWAGAVAEAGRRTNKAAAVEAVCFATHSLVVLASPFARSVFDLRGRMRLYREGRVLTALEKASELVTGIVAEP